jgi:hypothetical protein
MRTPKLCLGLVLLVGCGAPPAEVTTDLSTTDAPPTSGAPTTSPDDTTGASNPTSGSTGEEVCPPTPPEDGGYDPCPGFCGGGGQCYGDGAEYAVCTRGCFMDCNCWPAPAGDGDAPARCSDDLLESTSVCVLDCSSGQTCPSAMFCVADLGICAHPYPGSGSDTTEPGSTGSSSSSSDGGSTDASSSSGTDMSTGGTTDTSAGSTTDMSTGGTTDTTSSGTTDMGSTGSTGGTTGTSTT